MSKCKICKKSVYQNDSQINIDGAKLHKSCSKCMDCNCQITLTNFAKYENEDVFTLLCVIHYSQRFRHSKLQASKRTEVKSTVPTADTNHLTSPDILSPSSKALNTLSSEEPAHSIITEQDHSETNKTESNCDHSAEGTQQEFSEQVANEDDANGTDKVLNNCLIQQSSELTTGTITTEYYNSRQRKDSTVMPNIDYNDVNYWRIAPKLIIDSE